MIKELIVVEGVNDTKRLQSFFDVDTIETHGMGLSKETIELVRQPMRNVASSFFWIPMRRAKRSASVSMRRYRV